jgi:hypothetical protein
MEIIFYFVLSVITTIACVGLLATLITAIVINKRTKKDEC